MRKPSPELKALFNTYLKKTLRPETALEFASGFSLDLINAFGELLSDATPLQTGWIEFAPFAFILQLNALLARYKENGYDALDDVERILVADTHVMLGALIGASCSSKFKPTEGVRSEQTEFDIDSGDTGRGVQISNSQESYQIPREIKEELDSLIG